MLSGCGKKPEEEKKQPKADENIVTLTKANLEHVEIKTEPVVLGNLATTLKAAGRVSANANKTAKVSSTLEGRLVTLHVDLNDRVKRGDILALVEAPELLGKQLELKAPIDGVIVERKSAAGEQVDKAKEIFTISEPTNLWVIAEIKERDIGAVKVSQDASFSVLAYPGETFRGKVVRLGNQVEAESRTLEVRIEVSNADGRLKPGMFADVEITTTILQDIIVIPDSALQTRRREPDHICRAGRKQISKARGETRHGTARTGASARGFEGWGENRDRRQLHSQIGDAQRGTGGIIVIDSILNFSVRQRMLVILAAVILTGFGILALQRIPIDAFPDVTNVQVQVLAKAGGMSPPEVEKLVTRPIEIQMGGLPRLMEIRSVSKIGLAAITIVFEDGVNDYFARQLVSERLASARENLPAGVDVELGPITTGLGEVFQYTLVSKDPKYDATEIRTIQDYIVRPSLRTVPGVADVNSFGGFVKQFQVVVRPERLTSFHVSLQQVFEALAKNNSNASGNFIEHQSEQYVVRGLGLVKNTQDIGNIIVAVHEHTPIYVRDVAEVRIGAELRQGAVTMNGEGEVVSAIVLMLKGASGRDVVNGVKEKLPAIQRALPKGVELIPFYDRTDLVRKAIHTVTSALEEGAVLVLIILVVLLADIRSALIVTLVLPLAALFAFIMMRWYGLSANLMSLGGLAIGIGMMVDGAVVMVENIHRHLTEKPDPGRKHGHANKIETVLYAAKEVGRPIVFGIAIIIIVFLPLFTLQGFEGKMFSPLAFTISFALFGSLILSLTLVPALGTFFLKQVPHEHDPFHIRWLKHFYFVALKSCITHPWRIVLAALIALIVSLLLVPFIGTEFLPSLDEGAVAIEARSLPSISLRQAVDLQTRAQRIFKQFPEVIDAVSKTGRADIATDPMGIDSTDMMMTLRPQSEWTSAKTKEELVSKMRSAFADLPGVTGNFTQPIALRVDELVSGVKSAIGIKIFGDDLKVLKDKADAVGRVLSKVGGATDVNVEKVSGLAYLQIEVDRERIARYGINVADIHDVIETAIGGKEASKVYDGMKVFGLAMRFPESARNDVEPIREILIPSPSGALIPLGQLAKVEVSEGPAQISREMAQRRIVIECNVTDRDIGSFVAEAKQKIDNAVKLPPGYMMTWGGQFENQQRAMKRFSIVVPITIAAIFLLLFSSFNSVKQALLIIMNIPFALIGGILALVIGRFNLSVSASIGFIALFGVAVLNGVVMVSYFNELRREGMNVELAVVKGAVLRLRPVLVTASVAALGLIPMLFATGPGSEIQKPLAAVVIGGLISPTALTLFILPTLYNVFERKARLAPHPLPNPPLTIELA